MACESVRISFASLTCENFHACACLHVYFFFFISIRCGFCVLNSFVIGSNPIKV
ncbi:hypothetical protein HMPREF1433_00561 [Helicobacter pylori GAMchJs117Ai]|nr:hypothetical protein HMPREF1433_00561 [Helicobacter pylori GAMchJs117Ai]